MNKKERILKIIQTLEKNYPLAECSLVYNGTPLEFLIAVRLSAQCTDARVNAVTPKLFEKFNTLHDFANADVKTIENYVKSCNFYKTKSRDIVNMCKKIILEFGGEIPQNIKDLTSLPGVGRKTANLFLGEIYGVPGIVVDTHFKRVTRRLGLHREEEPEKVEKAMLPIVPAPKMLDFCHEIVHHGRAVCTARNPKCPECCLKNLCPYFKSAKPNA